MFDLDQVTARLFELVEEKNPEKVANYIYFVIKQFPDSPFCTDYEGNIKRTCNLVREVFCWDEAMTNEFVAKFRDLTKYLNRK